MSQGESYYYISTTHNYSICRQVRNESNMKNHSQYWHKNSTIEPRTPHSYLRLGHQMSINLQTSVNTAMKMKLAPFIFIANGSVCLPDQLCDIIPIRCKRAN